MTMFSTVDPSASLRVLLVSHYFPPHVGGIENVVAAEAAHLSRRGYHVEVITTGGFWTSRRAQSQKGYSVTHVPSWNGVEDAINVPFPVPAPWSVIDFWKHVRRADIVHTHDVLYMTSWIAAILCILMRKPLVLTQHVSVVDHTRFVMAIEAIVYHTIGRVMMRAARRIICINSVVPEFLLRLGADPRRLCFVPNGVDTELFRPPVANEKMTVRRKLGLPSDEVLALFVGRFVPKKGYEIVASTTGDGYRMVLVGGVSASTKESSDRLIFLGRRSPAELATIYRACDIFVLPSVGEGFPLVVQEAMSSALPVVTTDDPAYSVYGLDRNRVALVQPTSEAVSATLSRLAAQRTIRADMAQYSFTFAKKHFRWSTHAKALCDLYRELMHERCALANSAAEPENAGVSGFGRGDGHRVLEAPAICSHRVPS
jgi:D-inositol-3-phosphate glycosyltransferase